MSLPETETLEHQLAPALRRLRLAQGLTLKEVAQRMGKKPASGTQISRWERGESSPSSPQLWLYLLAVAASFSDLDRELHGQEPSNPRLREIAELFDRMGRESK